ncbi:VWA domain-containing protein [Alloscardovia omnicolens]|uniref:VWA domain-containing protein n=1 Tax=Alloscardovia omnicolens TaxID=419015 RepID=UPI003A5E3C1D
MMSFIPTRLIWPFAGLIALVICLILAGAAFALIRRKRNSDSVWPSDELSSSDHKIAVVYDVDADMSGETASRFTAIYRRMTTVAVSALTLCIISGCVLLARPASISSESTHSASHDIVLCLDVSGSALSYDRQIIAAYSQLTRTLHGERIGLSIFNSTAKTIFPLTDDYSVINNQLNYAYTLLSRVQTQESIDAMSDKEYQEVNDWLDGTQNVENSTSLIGDGLVSCTMMLPQLKSSNAQKARTASIILATDNVPSGKQTFTLNEALDIARSSHINVDALYVGTDKTSNSEAAVEMKKEIEEHGGTYIDLNSRDTVDQIVRDISSTKSGTQLHDQISDMVDAPALVVGCLVLSLMIFAVAAGRIRR